MSVQDQNKPTESVDECVQVSQEVPRDIEALSTDISGLWEEGILPDFQLRCQGQVFKVHKSVLAARSEVFRAMFRSGMRESKTGSADIKDLEAPVLQSLLKFVYSGQLGDLSEDTAIELYEASDQYAVRSLFAACSYQLIRFLTEDNCIHYLNTSNSHSDPDLKAAAVSFIIAHPGVFKGTAWLTFLKENPVLASEVLQTYVVSSSQQSEELPPKRFKKSD